MARQQLKHQTKMLTALSEVGSIDAVLERQQESSGDAVVVKVGKSAGTLLRATPVSCLRRFSARTVSAAADMMLGSFLRVSLDMMHMKGEKSRENAL
jgi:hypothetical protein